MIGESGPTVLEGVFIGASSLGGLILSVWWGLRAWQSDPAAWTEFMRRFRPTSWRRWPIYSALWRHMDSHGAWYLWEVRVGSVLGLLFCGVGPIIGAMIVLGAR